MKSNSYWENRANLRMSQYHKDSNKTINTICKAYDKAIRNINEDINNIYYNFALKGELSQSEATDLLNSFISIEEIRDLRDKIRYIKDEELRKYMLSRINSKAYKARITRLEALKESIYINLKLVADTELTESNKLYINNIKNAYYKTIFDIQKGLGFEFDFAKIDKRKVKEILKHNWSGKHYSKRIWNNTDVVAKNIQEVLLVGVMTGRSVTRLADSIKDMANGGKYAAERLIRTETTYMCNQAELESYKESDIDKYIFVATLDSRTSNVCREHDGQVYKVDEGVAGDNLPPLHAHCRSTTIAYFDDDTFKSLKRRATGEDGKTYVLNENMTYKEWREKHE